MYMVSAFRARLRLLFARSSAEDRMDEEIRFHIDMETERLVREEGLDPRAARRRGFVAFGGIEKVKEELRDGRGLGGLTGFSLDLKLGFRMLVKYPVLTGASVLALAVAVALAASWFEFSKDMARPRIHSRRVTGSCSSGTGISRARIATSPASRVHCTISKTGGTRSKRSTPSRPHRR